MSWSWTMITMPTCKTATGSIKLKLDLSRLNAELVHVCGRTCGGVAWPWRGRQKETRKLLLNEKPKNKASHAHDIHNHDTIPLIDNGRHSTLSDHPFTAHVVVPPAIMCQWLCCAAIRCAIGGLATSAPVSSTSICELCTSDGTS